MRRVKLALALLAFLAVSGPLFGPRVFGHGEARASATRVANPHLQGTDVFSPGMHRMLPFALRDQNHRLITPAALRGRVTIMTFLDSVCVKACPIGGRELGAAERMLGRRLQPTVVFISVDPAADTPATATKFVHKSGVRAPWHWLFGSKSQLLPIWREYGIWVQPAKGDILHTAVAYLFDQKGWMRVADGIPFIPSQLAGSIKALLMQR